MNALIAGNFPRWLLGPRGDATASGNAVFAHETVALLLVTTVVLLRTSRQCQL